MAKKSKRSPPRSRSVSTKRPQRRPQEQIRLERIAAIRRWVLLVATVGVPVVFLRFTQDPFNVPKLALLALLVSVAAGMRLVEIALGASVELGVLRRIAIPSMAVALPLFLSWLLSDYRGWATFGNYGRFQGLVPYLLCALLGVLVADAFRDEPLRILQALVIAGAIVGGYALIQVVGIDPFVWQRLGLARDALSTTGNPNFTGGFLAMCLPLTVALWARDPDRRTLALRAGAVIVVGWVVTFSQGAWAAGVTGLLLIAGHLLSGRFRSARVIAIVAALCVGGAVFGAAGLSMIKPAADPAGSTLALRGAWWREAIKMGVDSPVFGSGPNTFTIDGTRYRLDTEAASTNSDSVDDPHSVLMSFFANAGALGVMGLLALAAWIVALVGGHRDNLLAWGLLGGLAAYSAQALVSIDEITLRTTFWVMLGGLAACCSEGEARREWSLNRRGKAPGWVPVATAVVVIIGFLFAGWWAARLLIADAHARQGVLLFSQDSEREAASEQFERAIDLRNDVFYMRLHGFGLGKFAAQSSEAEATRLLPEVEQQYSFLSQVPEPRAAIEFADLLKEIGEIAPQALEEAVDAYALAVEVDPLNPLVRQNYADVLRGLGRADEAKEVLQGINQ